MRVISLVWSYFAFAGHGKRVQISVQRSQRGSIADMQKLEHVVDIFPSPQSLAEANQQISKPDNKITYAAPAIKAGFLEFPPSFVFGVATAAYQIEGAADEGGRKPSIWDVFSHTPRKTAAGGTGDVACDHYHRFQDDLTIMSTLNLQAYRFSISWSRLIPDGEGEVNEEGVKFYSDLIDGLLERGITPWVTLYHWDLPAALDSEFGGWLGPKDQIVPAFAAYARICFERFGDRVKNWITLNEPWCATILGFCNGVHAPGHRSQPRTEPYIAGHNMLLAHAEAVRIYRTEFAHHAGQIGITLNTNWGEPLDARFSAHRDAAQRFMDFSLGWFADPVYFGDYPQVMRETVGDRLPVFTAEEKVLLQGSSDFFGINSYTASYVRPALRSRVGKIFQKFMCRKLFGDGWFSDLSAIVWEDWRHWERTDMGWPIVPWGFRNLLLYIQDRYHPPGGIFITENGVAHEPKSSRDLDRKQPQGLVPKPYTNVPEDFDIETFDDPERVRYLRAYLSAVHAAIEAGADVRGYFCWSLMDNFEWAVGYAKRFGLVRVDYPSQKRIIKTSGRFFSDVIKNRGFDAPALEEQFGGKPF